jgi:hypothetical protein
MKCELVSSQNSLPLFMVILVSFSSASEFVSFHQPHDPADLRDVSSAHGSHQGLLQGDFSLYSHAVKPATELLSLTNIVPPSVTNQSLKVAELSKFTRESWTV